MSESLPSNAEHTVTGKRSPITGGELRHAWREPQTRQGRQTFVSEQGRETDMLVRFGAFREADCSTSACKAPVVMHAESGAAKFLQSKQPHIVELYQHSCTVTCDLCTQLLGSTHRELRFSMMLAVIALVADTPGLTTPWISLRYYILRCCANTGMHVHPNLISRTF